MFSEINSELVDVGLYRKEVQTYGEIVKQEYPSLYRSRHKNISVMYR